MKPFFICENEDLSKSVNVTCEPSEFEVFDPRKVKVEVKNEKFVAGQLVEVDLCIGDDAGTGVLELVR